MLDVIRAKSHSIVIKIAFGIIILVFCFWGVGSFTGGPSTEILTVNGQSLGIAELNQQIVSLENSLRQQNPNLGADDLRKMGIKKQAAQKMVFDALIAQEAARHGIVLTPVELRHFIENLPEFQNKDGKFDPELYISRMNGQAGESAGAFEQRIASSLLNYKVQQMAATGAVVPEATAKDIFHFGNERRVLEYVLFPKSDYTEGTAPSDSEIEAWYNLHQDKFKVPATADITYLNITPETIASKYLPSDDAVSAYYEKNKEQFRVPEQVRARHILFLSMKNKNADEKQDTEAKEAAEKAYNDLKNGADFAELAKKLSQDPGSAENGGELGWFDRTRMVPEFSEVAFALKEGEISKPVRTAYGYHIIQTEEIRPSSIRTFEDVRELIVKRLSEEEASGQLQEVLDQILLAVLGGKNMEETGAQYALTPISTGSLSAVELSEAMGLKPEDVSALMATPAGTVRDTPFVTKKGYLLAKVNASAPESVKKLADVKNEITDILTDEKQIAQAQKAAQAALLKKNADGSLADVASVVSDALPRGGFIEALGEAHQLIREAFNAPAGTWLPNAFTVGNGAAVVRVKEVIPADDSLWDTFQSQVMPALQQARIQEAFGTFVGILQNSATVLLKNEKILED